MTRFELPWANQDIDIHPEPGPGWDRVAVVGGWTDKARIRERWPHAAVVGPLRTLRGIDLLVRGLLANPQIRVLVWDGPDLTPGEGTRKALLDLWRRGQALAGVKKYTNVDMNDGAGMVQNVILATLDEWTAHRDAHPEDPLWIPPPLYERRSIILPPPAPEPTTRAPHGDPGDRITGATLADVWPRLLDAVLTCGREVPTQYGPTRELLSCTAVVRDPKEAIEGIRYGDGPLKGRVFGDRVDAHPTLGISWADVMDYAATFPGSKVGDGAKYSYGSRLRGGGTWWGPCVTDIEQVQPGPDDVECRACGSWSGPWRGKKAMPATCPNCGSAGRDQVAIALDRLRADPLDRAVFLTPWRPADDLPLPAGGEPCLVGAWFRAVYDDGLRVEQYDGKVTATRLDGGSLPIDRQPVTLHLVTVWRSRDAFSAWPLNAAAACLWLVKTAEKLGMAVGTYTDTSLSLHLYERDWNDAGEKVKAYKPPSGVRWDGRTIWRVEVVETTRPCDRCAAYQEAEAAHHALTDADFRRLPDHRGCDLARGTPAATSRSLRATAYAVQGRDAEGNAPPTEGEVVAVIEAKTPDTLCRRIAESGLVQEPSALLWLGTEIERVWRGR